MSPAPTGLPVLQRMRYIGHPQPYFSDGLNSQVILLPYFTSDMIHEPSYCLISYGYNTYITAPRYSSIVISCLSSPGTSHMNHPVALFLVETTHKSPQLITPSKPQGPWDCCYSAHSSDSPLPYFLEDTSTVTSWLFLPWSIS